MQWGAGSARCSGARSARDGAHHRPCHAATKHVWMHGGCWNRGGNEDSWGCFAQVIHNIHDLVYRGCGCITGASMGCNVQCDLLTGKCCSGSTSQHTMTPARTRASTHLIVRHQHLHMRRMPVLMVAQKGCQCHHPSPASTNSPLLS